MKALAGAFSLASFLEMLQNKKANMRSPSNPKKLIMEGLK